MTGHAHLKEFCVAAVAAGLLACVYSAASADQAVYCVTCTNPNQTYRCEVSGDNLPSDALKLYCVIRTAKEGHHASCAAEKSNTSCSGIVKVYTYDGPSIPEGLASDPRVQRFLNHASRQQHQLQTSQKPKNEAPKTMAELTSRAITASRKGLSKARTAIVGQPHPKANTASANPVQVTPPAETPPSPTAADVAKTDAATGSVAPPESEPGLMRRAALSASAAVGGFARRSYRCMMSLFRHCGSDSASAQAPQ
jgi:hypothetical protein